MTLREFNGWTPTQTHTHKDIDGTVTGTTIVTTQSAWDDEQRDLALQLDDFEAQQCRHGHYLPKSTDGSVMRDVEEVKLECLDCLAIEEIRLKRHKKFGHTDKKCDCDKYARYVAKYLPLPENITRS